MLSVLTKRQQIVVDELWKVGAIKIDISERGGFRIKAQENDPTIPNSPLYLNIRTEDHPSNPGPVTSEIMDLIGDELFVAVSSSRQGWEFGWFADIPQAGTPFGDQIERLIEKYVDGHFGRLQLHKAEFDDGTRQITNEVLARYGKPPADLENTVLLVDDLITKAGTKLEAIRALEGASFTVVTILVLFDRGSGVEELQKLGYNVVAVRSVLDVVDFLLADAVMGLDPAVLHIHGRVTHPPLTISPKAIIISIRRHQPFFCTYKFLEYSCDYASVSTRRATSHFRPSVLARD